VIPSRNAHGEVVLFCFPELNGYRGSVINVCIVPRWLDRFLDLIGVNVLDCRRAGAEQNPTDHIAPEEQVGILRSPLNFITIHPLCWDCKCWIIFCFFTESFLVDRVRGLVVQGGMKPFSVVKVHIALDASA